ncbi:MAG: RDD family protein [Desulfomonilaceae bacterium]|nr:RDD family protein [Desulfomonilaceae bacterium]
MKQNVQTVTVETPEHFELEFRLAGIGTRFLAFLLDRIIQFGVVLTLILMVSLFALLIWRVDPSVEILKRLEGSIGQWMLGAAILLYGIIVLGYFILFEYFWSGSTPGKRWQDIRVIRTDGRPISFLDSAVRNILRFVDILFEVYPIGLMIMFVDGKNRRLGDLAAGTLVVMDKEIKRPTGGTGGNRIDESDSSLRPIVSAMTPADYRLVSRFLARRASLERAHRSKLAAEIRDRVIKRSNGPIPAHVNVETWLERVEQAYRRRTRVL